MMNMLTSEYASISARAANPEIAVIEVQGNMSEASSGRLMATYHQIQGPGVRTVLLDFSRMGFLNSGGVISLLLTLLLQANHKGQILAACGLSPHLEHLFKAAHLDEAIPCYPTLSAALAALHDM